MQKPIGKSRFSRLAVLLLCFLMISGSLCGCSSSDPGTAPGDQKSGTEPATREITEMAGRKVTIPAQVNTVYCAVPTAEAMVYSLAPEKMAAWVNTPSDDLKKYLNERAQNLPVLGGWMGEKCTANLEEIAKLSPDLIIFMTDLDEANTIHAVQTSDSITDQTKRPVIVVDSSLTRTAEAYRFMGDALGVQERAEKLALYSEKQMKAISDMVAGIPDDKLVRVYYAEGTGGLATDPADSHHADVLKFVRGVNVADVPARGGQGMSAVSMEQVLSWNPELILVSSSTAGSKNYETILSDPAWADITAVKNKKVYITPLLPFGWFDRPPNIMRVLGVVWLGKLLYPEYVTMDLNQQTREFFSLFFDMELTDEQINELLKNAV